MPRRETMPDRASAAMSVGTPISVGGSGRMAPRVHTDALVVSGWVRSLPRPTARVRSTASGRRFSMASAPSSTGTPATSDTLSLPPIRGEPSSTVTLVRGDWRLRWYAAASPLMPPPTTTT